VGQHGRCRLLRTAACEQHGIGSMVQHLADDPHDLVGCLAGSVHGFRHALTQRPMVVDQRVAHVREWQAAQRGNRIVGTERAGTHSVEQVADIGLVHGWHATATLAKAGIGGGSRMAVP
jgi:hypothetical protein